MAQSDLANIRKAIALSRPYCCEEDSGPLPCLAARQALELLDQVCAWLAEFERLNQ